VHIERERRLTGAQVSGLEKQQRTARGGLLLTRAAGNPFSLVGRVALANTSPARDRAAGSSLDLLLPSRGADYIASIVDSNVIP
jgi:hypothetical protein